ncbi:MAG: hypothetical protein HXO94_05465 [Streptococcus sp.]|jgi:hypothetical protein|nr:hypothetical protein [Streptococcus sp.]
MEELTWALRSAQVGIKGGALLLVATVVLFAAGLGADGFLFTIAALLIVATYVTIFVVALKSAIYYKGDARVKKWASNLFLLAGIIGCVPIVIVILSKVLFLDQALLQFFDVIEEEVDIFLILFPPIVVVGVLSIISGLGYASCLKNFKE